MITTVTTKGQATIPASIRHRFGIKPGQKILFEERGNEIVIKRILDIASLRGSLKTNIKWNKKKAYEAVGKMLAERYLKTISK